MAPERIAEALTLAVAAALMMAGSVTAWAAGAAAKRVAGVLIVLIAAMAALGTLGAPAGAYMTAVAMAFGYCALGAALTVRLQEAYASTETREIDAADDSDEPPEQSA
jgi:hypothetical protein